MLSNGLQIGCNESSPTDEGVGGLRGQELKLIKLYVKAYGRDIIFGGMLSLECLHALFPILGVSDDVMICRFNALHYPAFNKFPLFSNGCFFSDDIFPLLAFSL